MATGRDISRFGLETRLTMIGRNPDDQCGFVNPPLFKGSTVLHKTLEDIEQHRGRFSYGTKGTPTIANLEDAWTHLTGAAGTVLSPSGLGAVALALMSTTKAGDHILVPDCVYLPSRRFCNGVLRRYGVETSYYDPMIGLDVEGLIRRNTTVIFMEAPGSQTMEVQDIPAFVRVARRRGIKTILDNTWATPIFFDAHGHGVDMTVEAGTKYLGGHSDILLGLTTANPELWPALRATYDAMAMLPGAEDCLLALRGMRTMHLRLKEAERKALELAAWLEARPEVGMLLHPAFPDCPGHENWLRDFRGSSGLFSIALSAGFDRPALRNMLENMNIFKMGFSWGGYESLITLANPSASRTITDWSARGPVLRLQVGLEDLEDLKQDLSQGFERLNAT
jgi:cystathionine beta-lyase